MLKKFLKEIIVSIAGKQAETIIDLLDGKKYINEFIIAKKLNLTINQTRNILYKISDHGLVSFIRKKDKKKGWYTYFWKLEILKCLEFLKKDNAPVIKEYNKEIDKLRKELGFVDEELKIEREKLEKSKAREISKEEKLKKEKRKKTSEKTKRKPAKIKKKSKKSKKKKK